MLDTYLHKVYTYILAVLHEVLYLEAHKNQFQKKKNTADLITVLRSLFEEVTRSSSSEAPKITSRALNKVYQEHKLSDPRRQIYRCISAQILGCDKDIICRLLRELLGCDPKSPPDQESKVAASSSPSSGVAAQPPPGLTTQPVSTAMATPSPTGVAVSSPQSNRVPAVRTPPRSTSPPVWHCLFPCLPRPSQHSP